tara:strand:+ start:1400 stop:3133 length:1734 start_codon:yes stop_codon:yes gene_type:complete
MPGGLMNLVAEGKQNIILTGNPSKSFFKCTYAKYTNFGLQKFRIDYDGLRTLHPTTSSNFKFKMPRTGGDLIMDTYLVVNLPTIWSPIIPPKIDDQGVIVENNIENKWRPYKFKWIKHIGSQMIERVRFTIGGQVIQEFTGQYLYNMVERDFDAAKKDLYYKMTGHVPELYDPANVEPNNEVYPNSYYIDSPTGPEPSIHGRALYIPLNIWFTLASKMSFPLVSLHYNEFYIEIDIKPIKDLYVIQNIPDENDDGTYYHQPNYNNPIDELYRFLHPPPSVKLNKEDFLDQRINWDTDIHLISTYAFLSEDEQRVFKNNDQIYLIKQIYETKIRNIIGSKIVDLETRGMVSNWMWYFQRSDIAVRNEWSNYTNWPYDFKPFTSDDPDVLLDSDKEKYSVIVNNSEDPVLIRPSDDFHYKEGVGQSKHSSGHLITGRYYSNNKKNIMETWGLLLDGKYRENPQRDGVLNYIEKYTRTSGNAKDGLYCYNFGLNNNVGEYQPSGAINLTKFNKIQFELGLIIPPMDPSAQVEEICIDGEIVGIDKTRDNIYEYTYDLTVIEERYNVLTFSSGNAALSYAR